MIISSILAFKPTLGKNAIDRELKNLRVRSPPTPRSLRRGGEPDIGDSGD